MTKPSREHVAAIQAEIERITAELRDGLAKRLECTTPAGRSFWRDYVKSCVRRLRVARDLHTPGRVE